MSSQTPTPNLPNLPTLNGDQYGAMYYSFQDLEGKILTFADSLFPEGQQNKAAKDMLRFLLHEGYSKLCLNVDPEGQRAPNQLIQKRRK